MSEWAALDETLTPEPLFVVEAPDKKPGTELQRQATLLKLLRHLAPDVIAYANTNGTHIASLAGRAKANREGRTIGAPDLTVVWNRGVAWIEMKAGKGDLNPAQIDFGNRLHRAGQHVGCFRDPMSALEWLRSLGAPVRTAQ
ncbi:VRR-NUC domain-containing protein [Sphingomonas sp. T9W2]|uniref:VRR-NUC domain-containing protein n=1 Tax=Sphingomonas sp. T9W2 TaxID=3143183 RepID=UPI0031F4FC94